MIIKLEIFNEHGKIKEDCIDLKTKLLQRGITQVSPRIGYKADNIDNCSNDPQQGINNQFNAVSGGQLLPPQQINRIDNDSNEIQYLNRPISVNVEIRYDKNEPLTSRWNIDLYVDIDDNKLNWHNKRLITKRPKKAHHVGDSQWIRVDYWIDGVKQNSIQSNRP